MAANIWIVGRTQGEYSDRSETNVCWFDNEADARSFCVEAERQCRDAANRWRYYASRLNYDAPDGAEKEFNKGLPDPTFRADAYGADDVSFWVNEVPPGTPVALG